MFTGYLGIIHKNTLRNLEETIDSLKRINSFCKDLGVVFKIENLLGGRDDFLAWNVD